MENEELKEEEKDILYFYKYKCRECGKYMIVVIPAKQGDPIQTEDVLTLSMTPHEGCIKDNLFVFLDLVSVSTKLPEIDNCFEYVYKISNNYKVYYDTKEELLKDIEKNDDDSWHFIGDYEFEDEHEQLSNILNSLDHTIKIDEHNEIYYDTDESVIDTDGEEIEEASIPE